MLKLFDESIPLRFVAFCGPMVIKIIQNFHTTYKLLTQELLKDTEQQLTIKTIEQAPYTKVSELRERIECNNLPKTFIRARAFNGSINLDVNLTIRPSV